MPIPAIIGLIGSVLGAVVSNALQQQGINDMNRYNSPGAQASRLQQAGFSPANVFSQGAPAGVQSLIGNYQNSIGSDAMAAVSASQQAELYKSQKQALESEAALKNAQTIQQILESDVFKKYADQEKQYQLANYVADIALKNANAGLARAQTVTESSKQMLMSAQYYETLSKIGVNNATIKNLESVTNLNNWDLQNMRPEQLNKLLQETKTLEAQATELVSRANLNAAQKKTLDETRAWVVNELKARANLVKSQDQLTMLMQDVQIQAERKLSAEADLTEEQAAAASVQIAAETTRSIFKAIPFVSKFVN